MKIIKRTWYIYT